MIVRKLYEFLDLRDADIDENSFDHKKVKIDCFSSDFHPLDASFEFPQSDATSSATLYKIITPDNKNVILYVSKFQREDHEIQYHMERNSLKLTSTGYKNYLIFTEGDDKVYTGVYTDRHTEIPHKMLINGMQGIFEMKTIEIDGDRYLVAVQGFHPMGSIEDAIKFHNLPPI